MPANIDYRKGNLLDVKSGVIAHGVNCQGVMGSGVALAIRQKWPNVYDAYRSKVKTETNEYPSSCLLGSVQYVTTFPDYVGLETFPVVANCFTQDSFGRDKRHVDYEAVAKCFNSLSFRVRLYGHLNIPKIGAGLGGGDWNVIESIIKSEYKGDVTVWEL